MVDEKNMLLLWVEEKVMRREMTPAEADKIIREAGSGAKNWLDRSRTRREAACSSTRSPRTSPHGKVQGCLLQIVRWTCARHFQSLAARSQAHHRHAIPSGSSQDD